MPHKLEDLKVKVVSTARRAVTVQCIGWGINGQLQRGYSCRAQMAMTFNCHGPQGARRSGKEKPDKKEILFGLPQPFLDPRTPIIKIVWFDCDRDANSMEIEEFIFGDNLRKIILCFFYRCSWYSVTKTGPRQQRIHEVISYIKAHKNSVLQVHTFLVH